MFKHRQIQGIEAERNWSVLKNTVSSEKAFMATAAIGEAAAQDMLELSGESRKSIKTDM